MLGICTLFCYSISMNIQYHHHRRHRHCIFAVLETIQSSRGASLEYLSPTCEAILPPIHTFLDTPMMGVAGRGCDRGPYSTPILLERAIDGIVEYL